METNHSMKPVTGAVFLVLMMPLLFWQCDRHEEVVGKYNAVETSRDSRIPVTLELQANGKGLWSIETDNAPFRWDRKQNKIRLHTQSGGVIEGTMDNETIQIAIPGMGVIIFKRHE